jgi:hypothetical protein
MSLPDVFTDTSNIPEVAGLYRAAISTAADAPFNNRPHLHLFNAAGGAIFMGSEDGKEAR